MAFRSTSQKGWRETIKGESKISDSEDSMAVKLGGRREVW